MWLLLAGCAVEEPPPAEPVAAAAPKKARTKASGRSKPAPKPCLAPPSGEGMGDEGLVSSVGLGREAIKGAMDAYVPTLLDCVPEGTAPSGTIGTEITVACSGVVSEVRITDPGGMPEDMVKCVQERLTYAEFPAHDLPDGETFGYPLTFRF